MAALFWLLGAYVLTGMVSVLEIQIDALLASGIIFLFGYLAATTLGTRLGLDLPRSYAIIIPMTHE